LDASCFKNLIKLFQDNPEISDARFNKIEGVYMFTNTQIKLFSDYGRRLNGFLKKLTPQKLPFDRGLNCAKKLKCEAIQLSFIRQLSRTKLSDGLLINNPIEAYQEILQEIRIKTQRSKQPDCFKCYKQYLRSLRDVRILLEKSELIQKYLELNRKGTSLHELYSLIFGDCNLISDSLKRDSQFSKSSMSCASYKVRGYNIEITKSENLQECLYEVSSIDENPQLQRIFAHIMEQCDTNFKEYFGIDTIDNLNKLLRAEKQVAEQLLKQQYAHLPSDAITKLAELVSFELTGLKKLMPLLLDDEIEEIFVDTLGSNIYLDHRQFGRCRTQIFLTPTEIENLKTRIRIEAEQILDEMRPFLKTELITSYFHVRVSSEITPLAVDNFQIRIRKLHKKRLTLVDLISNKTLSIDAAAYLLFSWIHGRCILAIGSPYSGKTTLINSIDIIGKNQWRKVYVEDAIESFDQSDFGIHQARFKVETRGGSPEDYSTKGFQVRECLHRTPDAIFIGELIDSEAVDAFFFLLKVGLGRCLATAHGESPEKMVKRFISNDKIPDTSIGDLDLIVQLEKIPLQGKFIRRVARVTEIIEQTETGNRAKGLSNVLYNDLFLRDPENDELINQYADLSELYKKSNIIKAINTLKGEYISEARFKSEFKRIREKIKKLMGKKTKINNLIREFHLFWEQLDLNRES
jgi:type IV secretory pathway ATPase VirB11/archaellum biosynthesis ATPase